MCKTDIFIFSVIAAILCLSANAQPAEWSWAISTDGPQNEQFDKVVAASDGALYALGSFGASFSIGGIEVEAPGNTTFLNESFLLKATATGEVEWVLPFSGLNELYTIVPHNLATDSEGNVYIAALVYSFSTAEAFDVDVAGLNFTIPAPLPDGSNIWSDGFIAKIDPQGNGVWVRNVCTPEHPAAVYNGILAVDEFDNIFWAADFQADTISIDGTVYTKIGGPDIFSRDLLLARLNTEGAYVWVTTMGSEGSDSGNEIAPAVGGGVLMSSSWTYGTVHVGGLTAVNPDPVIGQNHDRWIAKINLDGTAEWLVREGGPGAHVAGMVASTPQGGAMVQSYFAGVNASIELNEVVYDEPGMLLTRYSSTGILEQVAHHSGHTGGRMRASDGNGTYFLGFSHTSEVFTFGDFQLENSSGLSGNRDVAIVAIDENMTPLWAVAVDGEENEWIFDMAFGQDQGLAAAGRFNSSSLAFGNTFLENNGLFTNDAFLAAMDFTVSVTTAPGVQPLHLYPNPVKEQTTVDLSSFSSTQHTVRIFDTRGSLVLTQNVTGGNVATLEVSNLPKGSYVVLINDDGVIHTSKLVKL